MSKNRRLKNTTEWHNNKGSYDKEIILPANPKIFTFWPFKKKTVGSRIMYVNRVKEKYMSLYLNFFKRRNTFLSREA